MLGVPTRSDAMAIAPDYADAVTVEMLNEKLRSFDGIFSTNFPHNHVAEAYRDTGNIKRFMPIRNVRDIKPKRLPKGVDALLKPELVRDHFLATINAFRRTLEGIRGELDQENSVVVQTFEHKPYGDLLPDVTSVECVADYVYEGNALMHREGEGMGWRYTFNPFELAIALLDDFERTINSLNKLEPTKIEKITAMMKASYDIKRGANFKLVEASLRRSGRWPESIERDKSHPVYRLYSKSREIGMKSDLSLRFDEMYFVYKSAMGEGAIPASALLEPDKRMMYYMLSHRVKLRHVVNRVLDDWGRVVINDVVYERASISIEGQTVEGFITTGQSYQELADLLGKPVQQPDGTLLPPATWAEEEVQLVDAFNIGKDLAAIETLLERYELDTSSGNPTRQKALDQLAYSCMRQMF